MRGVKLWMGNHPGFDLVATYSQSDTLVALSSFHLIGRTWHWHMESVRRAMDHDNPAVTLRSMFLGDRELSDPGTGHAFRESCLKKQEGIHE